MGLEATCRARMGRASATGKARLEETDLVFRGEGDLKFKVPLKQLQRVDARGGALYLEWGEGKAVLDLGDQAARKAAITSSSEKGNPSTRARKCACTALCTALP